MHNNGHLKNKKVKTLGESFSIAEQKQSLQDCGKYEITAHMFRIVYTEVKMNIPLMGHRDIVQLIHLSGGSIGYNHYERTSALRMAELISETFHQQLTDYILQSDSPWSIICDGASDPRQNHYLTVLLQGIEHNLPKVYFYRLILIGSDETAEGLMQLLINAFEDDGIKDKMKQNLIGFTSDGANVMMGKFNGLAKKVERFAARPIIATHCMAHRLELAILHAYDGRPEFNFMNHMPILINEVYSFFYGQGHKKKAYMREVLKDATVTLNYIFEVRWITSERSALRRIIDNFEGLIKVLQKISESENFDAPTKYKAGSLANKLQNKNFFMLLNFRSDIARS